MRNKVETQENCYASSLGLILSARISNKKLETKKYLTKVFLMIRQEISELNQTQAVEQSYQFLRPLMVEWSKVFKIIWIPKIEKS